MKNTTLCYLENDGAYLMLYRNKKENDENHEKWIGVGGKCKDGESPFDCATREIKEETGYEDISLSYRGIVTFVSNQYETQYMHLFTSCVPERKTNTSCVEGSLCWINKEKIIELPIWEGAKIFLELLNTEKKFFSLKLVYQNDMLISAEREM